MPEHIYLEDKDIGPDDTWGQLNIVDGGLALCKVCGGLEGALTTECPGEKIPYEKDQEVYRGKIDFVNGKWIEGTSKHSPAYWANYRKEKTLRD